MLHLVVWLWLAAAAAVEVVAVAAATVVGVAANVDLRPEPHYPQERLWLLRRWSRSGRGLMQSQQFGQQPSTFLCSQLWFDLLVLNYSGGTSRLLRSSGSRRLASVRGSLT